MKTPVILAVSLAALAMPGVVQPVRADSAAAMCEVRKDGDTKKFASGPCTFSQRQGYIDLDLRNGDKHSLAPGKNANHYKGGQAEGELERRGYVFARGSTSGDAKYSAWYNQSTRRCVMIRTADGRYQSIVQAPPSDCGG